MTLRRLLLAAGLLVLGAAALLRLRVHGQPELADRALEVSVSVPAAEISDHDLLADRVLVPVESAVRASGGVVAITGSVGPSSARLTVRLAPGVDPAARAARLAAAMRALERDLPRGSSASVDVARASEDFDVLLAVVPSEGAGDPRSVVDDVRGALERVPGVGAVELDASREMRDVVRLAQDDPARREEVAWQLERRLRPERLGRVRDGRRDMSLLSVAPDAPLAEAPVVLGGGVVAAGALGVVGRAAVPPRDAILVDGREATLAAVRIVPGASLLAVDRALRAEAVRLQQAGVARLSVVRSAADAPRRQLAHLGVALALAVACGACAAGLVAGRRAAPWGLVAPVLATAAAANAIWLTGARLDSETLPAAALGVAAALPWHALRFGPRPAGVSALVLVAAAGGLPSLGVALVPSLQDALGARAACFGLAFAGSVLAAAIVPPSRAGRPRLLASVRARRIARDPLTTGLLAASVAAALLTWFGKSLDPRRGGIASDRSRLDVALTLPEGTPLHATLPVAKEAWSLMSGSGAVEHAVAVVRPGTVRFEADVASDHQSVAKYQQLRRHLIWKLGATGASVRVDPGLAVRGTSLEGDRLGRARPETGEGVTSYRYVVLGLRAADFVAFEAKVRERVVGTIPPWMAKPRRPLGDPSLRLELVPRHGTVDTQALAERLRRASAAPAEVVTGERPARRLLVLGARDREPDSDAVPLPDLLGRPSRDASPVAPLGLLEPRHRVVPPALQREDGRYVAIVQVPISHAAPEVRREFWAKVDRIVERTPRPAGVTVKRPGPRPGDPEATRRRVALLALLPGIALAATVFLAGSWAQGALALLPALLAVAAAAPLVTLPGGALDDGALLLGVAVLLSGLPLSVHVAGALGQGARAPWPAAGHRRARETGGALALLVAAAVAVAACTLGTSAARDGWVQGLRLAALLFVAQAVALAWVVPAAVALLATWRRRDPVQLARMRRPPEWDAAGEPRLEVRRLTKVYVTGHRALHEVSFELGPGIAGLVGPNGAGKTTLLRTLTGLLAPSRGEVLWRGAPVVPANVGLYRREVGYLPQGFNAYEGFSGEQFLEFWAGERGMTDARARRRDVEEKLALVGLTEHAGRRVRDYSGGMRQRLGIARAMLGDPRLLIVDEPSTGLDVESRDRLREALLAYAATRIVLLSTHVASDIEATASRVLLLHRGRLWLDTDPAALIERAAGRTRELVVSDADLREISRLHRVTRRVRTLQGLRVRLVLAAGQDPFGEAVRPTLEEAYLAELDALEPGRRLGRSFARLARWE